MKEKFDTVSSELVRANDYWEYKLDRYVMPSGNVGEYHYVNSRGATFILPKLENNTFILIRQYRYLNRRYSIEFPGGGQKEGLTPKENALAELREEAGLKPGTIELIGEFNPYNGVSNEICHVFFAEDFEKCEAAPEESEELEIVEMSAEEINRLIKTNEIWDGMTLAAWSLYLNSDFYKK